jgi:acyl-CoA synthetase (AMP-forming)/AMP-acid ligase II
MIIDELAAGLRRDPSGPAVIAATRRGTTAVSFTRGDLADLADGYTAALHRRGLRRGQTVGVAVRPGGRTLAILLAARRLGLRVAAIDPTVGADVLTARLAMAAPALVLADAAAQAAAGWAKPLARRARLELPHLATIGPVATVGRRLPGCAPSLRGVHGVDGVDGVDGGFPDHRFPDNRGDGDAVVVFTSGTTARPRAVVHTWASLDAGMRAVSGLVAPRPGQPVLGGPLFVLVPALLAGAPVARPVRSGRGVARQLRALRPQATYLTPPELRAALAARARFTGTVWSGSAPVSATLLSKVKQAGAAQAWGVYALSELFPAAVVEAAEKSAFDGPGDLAGELVPGVAARVDPAGQLLLSGPAACDRYLGERPHEWVATGDVARLEAGADRSRVVLAGRCKDMILREAQNIYPGLYEPALHVQGVSLAVLVGVPAADGDERLGAVVELDHGADRDHVLAALRARFDRMGAGRPDVLLFAGVPLSGRSRKPDRQAAARLIVSAPERARIPATGTSWRDSFTSRRASW